jgi:polygalacturonase
MLTAARVSLAQDRRTVTEPRIPQVCSTLRATLTAHDRTLDEADEEKLDTERLQHALDTCGQGKALELAADGAHNAFLSGPILLPAGTTLLVDRGVTLYGSRDPKLYEIKPGSCGLVNNEPAGCKPLIGVNNAPHAAIMGDGAIDGRGGAKLLHGAVSWWDLANQARAGGRQQVPRLIIADHSDDFTLYRITLHNSANFHVVYHDAKGFTVWGLKIDTPKNARNTDGLDPGSAEDITVTQSFIRTGDDNIAIKGSGKGVQHMSVVDNHFYYGHGMSIGSETFSGVSDLLVRNLTLEGTDSGIRIKSNVSRGGLVQHAVYENVCIRDNKAPISIDTQYNNPGPRQDLVPEYRDIELHNVQVSGGGKVVVQGQDEKHKTTITLDGVLLDNPAAYKLSAAHAAITSGPGPVNFVLNGPDVSNEGKAGKAKLPSCEDKFVPFPAVP